MSKWSVIACVLGALVVSSSGDAPAPAPGHSLTVETLHEFRTQYPREKVCAEKPCIRKCCLNNKLVIMDTIARNSGLCKSKKKNNLTELSFETAKIILNGNDEVVLNSTFVGIADRILILDGDHTFMNEDKYYLNEKGELKVERPHCWKHWTFFDSDHYCFDHVQLITKEIIWRAFLWEEEPFAGERDWKVSVAAMLISSAFLVATLAVYSYVPALRNLHGKVIMAYAASLLVYFLKSKPRSLAIIINFVSHHAMGFRVFGGCEIHAIGFSTDRCTLGKYFGSSFRSLPILYICRIALITYYSVMATLFWMNIMSYDIWWKFRGIINAQKINRRGESHKFLMYCLYGFGCPLLMTVTFTVLNSLPADSFSGAIVTPRIPEGGCFIGGLERIPYLYIPMSIITSCNLILFVMTILIIYKLKRDSKQLESSGAVKGKNQLFLYVKIFTLMGVSWILDFISTNSPGLSVWYIADAFNFLIGVFIFFIFVGKRRILGMVSNKYRERAATLPSRLRSRAPSCTSSGPASNDTEHSNSGDCEYTQHVTLDPKAPEIC